MELMRNSDLDDLFARIETKLDLVVLYVDQTPFCLQYASQGWVAEEASVVEIDQEIMDGMQIGKVPQFRFYRNGTETKQIIGTVGREEFLQIKRETFDVPSRK